MLAAPNADLSVPRSVSGLIACVAGLDGGDRLMKPAGDIPDAPPAPAFVNAPPCSAYWGEKIATGDKSPDGQTIPAAYGGQQPYATCGYTPSQLEGAYGVKSAIAGGLDGRGQTVAIVDAFASPTIAQDANQYATTHGQPPVPLSQILPPNVSNDPDEIENCDPQGCYGEESLDVEAVHAMAPGAHVLYAGGEDCFDENLIEAVNKIVDGRAARLPRRRPVTTSTARAAARAGCSRARLPEAGRPEEARQRQPRQGRRPGGPGREPRRRPANGHAGRADADLPRRDGQYSEYRLGGTSLS